MVTEGGVLPWKVDKTEVKPYWDEGVVYRPLPAPPAGKCWQRDEKGNYDVVDIAKDETEEEEEKEEEIVAQGDEFIEHIVMPSDTLAGMCLRYKTKRSEIRRYNPHIFGDNIRCVHVLRIPIKKGVKIKRQKESREVKLQKIRNASTGLGTIEAAIYLDAAKGDLKKAIESAKRDDAFELSRVATKAQSSQPKESTEDTVLIHLDKAMHLKDSGILSSMHIYVVASLWLDDIFLGEAESGIATKTDTWRWSAAASGSTLELSLSAGIFSDLSLYIQLKAQNELLNDDHIAASKKIPISRLVDGAIHAIALDTGGDLFLSIRAPASLPRDAVRAVPICNDDSENPFIPPAQVVLPSFLDATQQPELLTAATPAAGVFLDDAPTASLQAHHNQPCPQQSRSIVVVEATETSTAPPL